MLNRILVTTVVFGTNFTELEMMHSTRLKAFPEKFLFTPANPYWLYDARYSFDLTV